MTQQPLTATTALTPKNDRNINSNSSITFQALQTKNFNTTNSITNHKGYEHDANKLHHFNIDIYFLIRFSNLGNTCYMNSILQCLLNLGSFSYDLMFFKQKFTISQFNQDHQHLSLFR